MENWRMIMESMKKSYTETLKRIFDDIEISIDGISGFKSGIRLSNLMNKL